MCMAVLPTPSIWIPGPDPGPHRERGEEPLERHDAAPRHTGGQGRQLAGRGLHSSASQLNLSHSDTKTHPSHPLILPYNPKANPKQPLNAPLSHRKRLC
jgi:hypothetical protein